MYTEQRTYYTQPRTIYIIRRVNSSLKDEDLSKRAQPKVADSSHDRSRRLGVEKSQQKVRHPSPLNGKARNASSSYETSDRHTARRDVSLPIRQQSRSRKVDSPATNPPHSHTIQHGGKYASRSRTMDSRSRDPVDRDGEFRLVGDADRRERRVRFKDEIERR